MVINSQDSPQGRVERLLARGRLVLATLLGYLGAYKQRRSSELSKLAAWPHATPAEARVLVHDMLEHAAGILGAARVLMAWEEPEEPWLHLALWSRSTFHWTHESPATFAPLVAEPLAATSFLCLDARAPVPTALHRSSAGVQRWHGVPLHPQVQAQFAIGAVLSLRLQGESLAGRLFFLDKPRMTSDDLILGTIVAHEVVARMDQFSLLQRLQQAAATEERIRLARDLHDGLLQSLTGAALQLETVHRLLEKDPQVARERVLDIQRLLAAEQRDLRSFIQELKPTSLSPAEMDACLTTRLQELGERIERHWGLRVAVRVERLAAGIPKALARDIYRIVHEAFINAARHAHAAAARVELGVADTQVCITVADDGCGFPFRGHYDLAALTTLNLGPVTLKERIASLGGSLVIDSSDTGARLHITLPLARPGA